MRIELADRIQRDFNRIFDHLEQTGATDPRSRIEEIIAALDVLLAHPRMGRPVGPGRRELVLGEGPRAYIALYQYFPRKQLVLVKAIRAQRESGYRE